MFVLVCVMLIAFTLSTVISSNQAQAASVKAYRQVVVDHNETLWNIAQENATEDMDIRFYIDEICETNDIDENDALVPGQVVFVPVY